MVSTAHRTSDDSAETGEVSMFATIKNLIPEPRQADQPHRYVGRHRQPDDVLQVVQNDAIEADPDGPELIEEPVPAGLEQQTA
jgi:hypothetical protein